MNQEILDKLHTALFEVSPLEEDREKIIAEMGETIWIESLEKMMLALPEDARNQAVACLNADDLDKAVEIFAENNVDLDATVKEVSTSVKDEVLAQVA